MTEHVLIDTSAWIDALRSDGDGVVGAAVTDLAADGRAVLCEPVLLELWSGAQGEAEIAMLHSLERELPCLPATGEVWALARQLARRCRAAGVTVPAIDLLVLAHARHHEVQLLQRDRHFDQIAAVGG